jgi:sugar phosphate isomerase/epimerase
MKILYFHSMWGLEDSSMEEAFAKIKDGGFDGVELAVPLDPADCVRARRVLDQLGLRVIAQQWRTTGQTVAEHQTSFEPQYRRALLLQPLFLNSHTGRDHFAEADNIALFDHAEGLAAKHGLPVYHETHRGRALFSAPATRNFLAARPRLRLTADFSHWCCVHESLLEDQETSVAAAVKQSYHIHARVGHAEGPQVSDPRDPLWQPNIETHLKWWRKIIEARRAEGCTMLSICPEFGPAPYMTSLPHSKKPIADLWEINCFMKDWLKTHL